MKTVLVVGAGLAGLSAAIRLADAGLSVTVLEKDLVPGGRIRRLQWPDGQVTDFGQHLLLGCYRQATALARRLQTATLLAPVEEPMAFVSGPGQAYPFRLPPAPLPTGVALASLGHLSLGDRIRLARVALAARLAGPRTRDLDALTAREWLQRCGQSPAALEGFWEPLVLATLNLPTEEASAWLLAVVLRKAFLGSRGDATALLPPVPLHDVFVGPAIRALETGGHAYVPGCRVLGLETDGAVVQSLQTSRGPLQADAYLLAIPAWDFVPLALGPLADLGWRAARLGASAILSVEIWFRNRWMRFPYVALLGTTVQWLFHHPLPRRDPGDPAERVTAVISHAGDLAREAPEALVQRCLDDLRSRFPEAGEVVQTRVLKAARATIRAGVRQATLRPVSRTPLANLFLAGDWTATGLPATIEGAVSSGFTAADEVLRSLRSC